ncbi:MAG TPA: ergothioneine biosynthesis protein EgtB [Burkholderiaceae bacterium]|nr:ergothioneine biosynthesis protein EgtB [Burkholderiaceae bacterium]
MQQRLTDCRSTTTALIEGLNEADVTVQSMDDASPAKWHLAHTTWFFEEFVLGPWLPEWQPFDPRYRFLFNSYYDTVGARHPRPRRGLLTRPALDEVLAYRARVDEGLDRLFGQRVMPEGVPELLELGIAHEQQHQELLLTDILHLFAQNPLKPAWRKPDPAARSRHRAAAAPARWVEQPGGCFEVGHAGDGFAFDCERPRHQVLLAPYALASRPVNNREWLEFIDDGGYSTPTLWLSDGWKQVQDEGWSAPSYWTHRDGEWWQMTLLGESPLEPDAPVSHVSYFEADAFARWRGARLPTEFEWEAAARDYPVTGNFASGGRFRPMPPAGRDDAPLQQLYGDVWEWTASAYAAYPGFRTAAGAVGEYNGKFMCGQFVLRGGSCATPAGHLRPSYRNFFYPHQRWQFCGLRLARD